MHGTLNNIWHVLFPKVPHGRSCILRAVIFPARVMNDEDANADNIQMQMYNVR